MSPATRVGSPGPPQVSRRTRFCRVASSPGPGDRGGGDARVRGQARGDTGQESRSPGHRPAPSVMDMATTTSTAAHTILASVTLEVADPAAARRFYRAFGVDTYVGL